MRFLAVLLVTMGSLAHARLDPSPDEHARASRANSSFSRGEALSIEAFEGQIVNRTANAASLTALEIRISVRNVGESMERARTIYGPVRVAISSDGSFRFPAVEVAPPTGDAYLSLEGGVTILGRTSGSSIERPLDFVDTSDVVSKLRRVTYLVPRYLSDPRLVVKTPSGETFRQYIGWLARGTRAAALNVSARLEIGFGISGRAVAVANPRPGEPAIRYPAAVAREDRRVLSGRELDVSEISIQLVPEAQRFALTIFDTGLHALYNRPFPTRISYDARVVFSSTSRARGAPGFEASSYVMDFVERIFAPEYPGSIPRVLWSDVATHVAFDFGDDNPVFATTLTRNVELVRAELARTASETR